MMMLHLKFLPTWRNTSIIRLSIVMLLTTTHLGQSGSPFKNARGSFKSVDRKPSLANLIETIDGKDRLHQCMKECLFDEDCLITVFDSDQKTCNKYNSSALGEELASMQTAVRKESWDTTDALTDLTSEISSLSVSTEQAERRRDKAIDGIITADNGWSAQSSVAPKWFQMNFAEEKIVYKIDVLSRCGKQRQSTGYLISYNGGFKEVTRVCSTSSSTGDCTDTHWETYPLGLGGVGTTYVNVSASTFCDDVKHAYYGIREIKIYGL